MILRLRLRRLIIVLITSATFAFAPYFVAVLAARSTGTFLRFNPADPPSLLSTLSGWAAGMFTLFLATIVGVALLFISAAMYLVIKWVIEPVRKE